MTVTDITEVRRRRDEHAALVANAAEWILTAHPVQVPWIDSPDFHAKWPGLDHPTLSAIEATILTRLDDWQAALIFTPDVTEAAVDEAMRSLPGRYEVCERAATWLDLFPDRDRHHPDFVRFFGDMTAAELVLANAERLRRVIRANR